MVSFKQLILGSVALIGMVGTANAGLAQWEDTQYQFEYVGENQTHVYLHNILADGFNPFEDHVNSFALTIDLWDADSAGEKYKVYVGLENAGSSYTFGNDAFSSGTNWSGLLSLNWTGFLTVIVQSVCKDGVCGDFYVGNSHLVATGTSSTQVPEPASLPLLGLGLLGVGLVRSKKRA